MALQPPSLSNFTLEDAAYALAWLLAFALVLPVQLLSMILFDSTGLDVLVPPFGFMVVVPALVAALLPTLLARLFYTPKTTRLSAGVAFVACAAIAWQLLQFYGMCGGPGC